MICTPSAAHPRNRPTALRSGRGRVAPRLDVTVCDKSCSWPTRADPPFDITGFGAYLYLMQFFTSVRVAATLSNPYGLHNQEWGGHVYICTGPHQPWAQIWPQLRHYG